MIYTREMAQAEADLQRAMKQWNIVRSENTKTGTGVFTDTDTRLNGATVPTRMEYVHSGKELQVTRITQGNRLIYGRDAHGRCHESDAVLNAFFVNQPQMEAVFNAVTPTMSIPFNRCGHIRR